MDVTDLNYHAARILILVDAFSRKSRSKVDGLTKLAKLDFLLRYPVFLERLLALRKIRWPAGSEPTSAERLSVESRMVRYKFGPWDDRYYPIIGILVGKKLLRVLPGRGKISLRTTAAGRKLAKKFSLEDWKREGERSQLLNEEFNLSGTELKKLIYKEFSAELELPWRAEI